MEIEENGIKIEIDNVCRGCLSVNRNLKPLQDNADLFFTILGSSYIPEDSKYFNLLLCWECLAKLESIAAYQIKIQQAQGVFLGTLVKPLKCLSNLKTINKTDVDYVIEYNELEVKEEKVIAKVEPELEEVKEESDGFEDFDDFEDKKVEIPVEKEVPKRKSFKNVKKILNITPFTVSYDIDEIDKHIRAIDFKFDDLEEMMSKKYVKYKIYLMKHYLHKIIHLKRKPLKIDENVERIKCSICGEVFDQSAIKDHWDHHAFTFYKCRYCNCLLLNKENAFLHLKDIHGKVYVCSCGCETRSRKRYLSHYKEFHKNFICDMCNKLFKSKHVIEKHMECKHLPFKCNLCPRTYRTRGKWKEHFFIHHPEVKEESPNELVYCVECDLKFQNRFMYLRHLRTAVAHRPRVYEKIPCPDCGKIFSRKTYMKNHYNFVHANKSKYYCELCDKYFANGYGLRTHKKFVHDKEEKPKDKMCGVCGRGFATNRTLTNHIRTHTGEKPHKCTYCDASFAQITARKSHEKTQHKNIKIEADLI